jgi:hypothetical protein
VTKILTWCNAYSIDKTSSAELSEAINSMYKWYQQADICYAYLSDVVTADIPDDTQLAGRFKMSKWFTRGWTLQELIAPRFVEFYAEDWTEIGTRSSRREELSIITGIDVRVLGGENPAICNVAERFSWAASRATTRVEDGAYCLLGIFQVHMPLLYGEGERAIIRLQEEIFKTTEDYTLLARGAYKRAFPTVLQPSPFLIAPKSKNALASSLSEFAIPAENDWRYSDLELDKDSYVDMFLRTFAAKFADGRDVAADSTPTLTAKGLHICLPIMENADGQYLAYLYCKLKTTKHLMCMPLVRIDFNRFERRVSESDGDPAHHYLVPIKNLQLFRLTRIFVRQKPLEVHPLNFRMRVVVSFIFEVFTGPEFAQKCKIQTSWGSNTGVLPWKTTLPDTMGGSSFQAGALFFFPALGCGSNFLVMFGCKSGSLWCCVLLADESPSPYVVSRNRSDKWDSWKAYENFFPSVPVDRAKKQIPRVGAVNVSIRKILSRLIVKIHINERASSVAVELG